MKRRLICILLCFIILLSLASCGRQKIEFSYFAGNFNPFSTRNYTDFAAVALTQAYLVTEVPVDDVSAIEYNAYSAGIGIADITYVEADDDSYADYTIKLGDDVKFSNGTPVTAKDVAFSLYVYADIEYDGWARVGNTLIDGLDEYRYNNSNVGNIEITDEQIEAELKNPSERTKELMEQKMVLPVLEDEYRWIEHLYTDEAYKGTEAEKLIELYPEVNDLFAYYYSIEEGYIPAADKQTLINDIAKQFGFDYVTLGEIYGSDLTENAEALARRALTEKALESAGGDAVDTIRGINIVDDKTLTVRINSVSENQLADALGVFVVPFDVYGKDCTFDGQGFDIDMESVMDPALTPVGAGACVFDGYTVGEGVKLSENKHYYKESTFECNVLLKETGNSQAEQPAPYFALYDERLIVEK